MVSKKADVKLKVAVFCPKQRITWVFLNSVNLKNLKNLKNA
jgi:hypothetical protein